MRYRRDYTPGGCFAFTVVTHRRGCFLDRPEALAALRASVSAVRAAHPFAVEAWVVLPDHMHAVWTLPPGDADYATRWALVKAGVSRRFRPPDEPAPTASRRSKRERALWQRRYWEHRIRDGADFARQVDYIHFNPVKHGLVTEPSAWPHSTLHRFVRAGLYPAAWSGAEAPDSIPGAEMTA